jgi:folate-binding protein YgfZ
MGFVRDLSARGRLVLSGADRVRFLHGMLTQDVESLTPGQGARAAMLTVKGKTVAELVVAADAERIFVETDAERRRTVFELIDKHIVMDDVEVSDVTDDTLELGVYGSDAAAMVAAAIGEPLPALPAWHWAGFSTARVVAAPDLAMAGFHVHMPKACGMHIAGQPLDDAAWEILRVEAGRPRWGRELDEDRLILEARLDDAISLDKGCYLGQEVVARATSRGHINRRLMGLKLDGEVAPGTRLSAPTRDDAGTVTSSVVSPRLGAIALAYIHRTVWEPGTQLKAGDRTAIVTDLPFGS